MSFLLYLDSCQTQKSSGFKRTFLHFVLKLFRIVLSVSPHSSCLCHLTLLVCVTSLFLSVSLHSSCLCHLTLLVCVTSLFLSVSPHSSCLCHLTLLVCVTSLFLSVSPHSSCLCHLTLLVCVTSLFLCVSPHSSCQSPAPVIYSLFVHISDERQRARLTNKSVVCTKLYLLYSSCQESLIY